ncbi:MAG: hypothetical protein H7A21_13525 [Spirochaetales bacterium]|nr:hypothetical protein [Leptospiraceae bacterium]MCP5482450.1 hypothetical protein [Spirochaetales bacterium]MCP5485846.1 hypothetical protein [Spirochaetales bacterium]
MSRPLRVAVILWALFFAFGACNTNGEAEIVNDPAAEYDRYWNDASRYLAGLEAEAGSVMAPFEAESHYAGHRRYWQETWPPVNERLEKMSNWAATELADANQTDRVVFYPFSGPDFLNAFTFFSNGSDYVLFGLEPAGLPPRLDTMSERERAAYLEKARGSLDSIFRYSFFRTNSMRVDYQNPTMEGLIATLMLFVARKGNRLLIAEPIMIDKDGKLYVQDSAQALETIGEYARSDASQRSDLIPGVRIKFLKPGENIVRTLVYLSVDVSNENFSRKPWFSEYIRSLGPTTTYLKAASYLLHYDSFARVRELIFDVSQMIVQDDSGSPLRYFREGPWDLSFYGNYTQPIPLFRARHQTDLRAVYARPAENGVRPLPFGTGYVYFEGQSNLMVARRSSQRSSASVEN